MPNTPRLPSELMIQQCCHCSTVWRAVQDLVDRYKFLDLLPCSPSYMQSLKRVADAEHAKDALAETGKSDKDAKVAAQAEKQVEKRPFAAVCSTMSAEIAQGARAAGAALPAARRQPDD